MVGIQTLEEFGKKLESFRFAVLRHTLPDVEVRSSHWDLLLEQPPILSNQLITFEVPVPPEEWGTPTVVRRLSDHRNIYLNYQGPVSGNRGIVMRVMEGSIQWQSNSQQSMVLAIQFASFQSTAGSNVLSRAMLSLRKLTGESSDARWELKLEIR